MFEMFGLGNCRKLHNELKRFAPSLTEKNLPKKRRRHQRTYLQSDRGDRRLPPPREHPQVVLDEGAVAEVDGQPGGDVVQAVFGYAASPPGRRSSVIRPEKGPNTTRQASGKRSAQQTASNMYVASVFCQRNGHEQCIWQYILSFGVVPYFLNRCTPAILRLQHAFKYRH